MLMHVIAPTVKFCRAVWGLCSGLEFILYKAVDVRVVGTCPGLAVDNKVEIIEEVDSIRIVVLTIALWTVELMVCRYVHQRIGIYSLVIFTVQSLVDGLPQLFPCVNGCRW